MKDKMLIPMDDDVSIKICGLKKQYRLGVIGGTTLSRELQSWWAKKRGKDDPNKKIYSNHGSDGEKFWALDGIDLEVRKGEAVGIIGANGAGKSTLLKVLSKVTGPTEGIVQMRGRISSMLEVGTGFHGELTGRENIYMNGAILGMSRKEVDQKMEEIIEFSECRQFIDTPVKRYSSGMYVKLAFAVAAHLDAEILIMDEVLAVGDVKFQKKCLGKMEDAAGYEGKTVLYVSHNMATIRQLCTRCIVLSHGKIIYDGDVETAIAVYTEQAKSELTSFYSFDGVKRPSADHGNHFFVHSLQFVGKEKAAFGCDEKVVFDIECSSDQDYENVGVYYTIIHEDDSIVGTTQTKQFYSIKAGERVKWRLAFDASNLVEGTYYFYLDIYQGNEYGAYFSIDHPLTKVYFQVVGMGNGTLKWNRKYLGSVKLNDLQKVE